MADTDYGKLLEVLNDKLDTDLQNPAEKGTVGQVLTIGENGELIWADSTGGGGSSEVLEIEYLEDAVDEVPEEPTDETIEEI